MAIEKTYFTDYDLTPIYTWLSANTAEYFDNVTISEDGKIITCYVGELDAFTITRDTTKTEQGTLKFTFKAGNGYSASATPMGETAGTHVYIRRLTKTSSGIAIAVGGLVKPSTGYAGTSVNARDSIFVTKDNKGNTAFVWATRLMTGAKFVPVMNNAHEDLWCINTKSSTADTVSRSTSENYFGTLEKDYVQLVPIGLDNQNTCYLPDCCLSCYSNVLGTETQLVQGDTKYVYNGYIALKE